VVEANKIEKFTDAELAQLTDVLTSIGDEGAKAAPKILKAANELRNLMDSTYYYNMNSGLDIGYVADVGFLPRMLDVPLVMDAAGKFINDAARVYDIVFERDTMRPGDEGVDIGEAIGALRTRIKEAGIDAQNDVNLQAYNDAVKELNKLNRDLNRATALDDGDAVDAAQAALNEFIENNMDVFNDAYDYVKGQWAQQAAADWQVRILYGSPEGFSSHSPRGSFTQRRVLPKEADKILAEYYIKDPVERITRYIEQSVMKSEYTRLFGNGQLTNQMNELINAKVLPQDQALIRDIVEQVTSTDQTRMPESTKRFLSNVHVVGNMTLLGRVVLTSLVEPMTVATQTGKPMDGLRAMGLLLEEAFATKNVREQRAIADLLGVVAGDMSQEIISNRLGGSFGESRRMQRMSSRFFRNVGLTGYDRASRRVSMQLIGRHIMHQSEVAEGGNKSERRFAMDELRDMGLTDAEMQNFLAWTREFRGRLPGLSDLTDPGSGELTPMGKTYGLMINRMTRQAIQDPSAYDRPWAANTVVGRMSFGLLSFSLGFQRNVMIKNIKKIGREYRAEGPAAAAKIAALHAVAPLAVLYSGHVIVTIARELLLNPERWEEEKEKVGGDFPARYVLGLAFSRAGFTGLADPVYNAYTGLKYQRDLANVFLGAGNSYFTQAAERIAKSFAVNSENTNAAERSRARGLYELLVLPVFAAGVGYVPGRMLGYGAGLGYAYLSSPRAKEKVQDAAAGESTSTKARAGQGGRPTSGSRQPISGGGGRAPISGSR